MSGKYNILPPCGGLWGERTLHTKFKSNLQASADGIFQAKIPPKMFAEILNASITHGHVLTEQNELEAPLKIKFVCVGRQDKR